MNYERVYKQALKIFYGIFAPFVSMYRSILILDPRKGAK